jgi:hypothetical protein
LIALTPISLCEATPASARCVARCLTSDFPIDIDTLDRDGGRKSGYRPLLGVRTMGGFRPVGVDKRTTVRWLRRGAWLADAPYSIAFRTAAGVPFGDPVNPGRGQDITGTADVQVLTRVAVSAPDIVRRDLRGRQPGIHRPGEYPPVQGDFCGETDVLERCGGAPGRIAALAARQASLHRVFMRGGVRQEHRRLAVLDPPRRAGALALDADTARAFLQGDHVPDKKHDRHLDGLATAKATPP